MQKLIIVVAAAAALTACAEKSKVAVNTVAPTVQTKSRSEPIFYNGKNYRLSYTYNNAMSAFDMKVTGESFGMTSNQKKDAVAIATSSLRYFACPDGQSGQLIGDPRFAGGIWDLQARCA